MKFTLQHHTFTALPTGALYLEANRTLIVSDLHLGKGQSFAPEGNLLPPYDTRLTWETLAQDLKQIRPRTVICLGDSFHNNDIFEYFNDKDLQNIHQDAGKSAWIWVTGNHDEELLKRRRILPGTVVRNWIEAGIHYTHQPEPVGLNINIFGHYHPKIRVKICGRYITGKCFLVSDRSVLCPAYGVYTGGLYWPDKALSGHFGQPRILLCRNEKVVELAGL
jgi:hypothetical protein